MTLRRTFSLTALAMLSAWGLPVLAVPVAQLDLSGGTWDPATQTVITTDSTFTLYGYGNVGNGRGNGNSSIDTTLQWYLSVALVPQSPAGTDFGSFTIDGTAYDTNDFVYGTPPLETMLAHQNGDLSQHGIYPTLFTVFGVTWDPTQTRSSVDTQNTPGTDPATNPGTALMWVGWDFNVAGLAPGYNLHFDLFGVTCTTSSLSVTNCTVKQFAPFSHDAETQVPEPATATLLGAGLLLLGMVARTRRRRPATA